MADNEKNQQQKPADSAQQTQTGNQGGQSQNTSGQGSKDQNPQGGGHWNNYRTRELSDEGTGEDNAGSSGRE
ncbi:MAG: hypothetical protein ACXVBX_06265 [Flavisolibacter sp.]